MNTLIRRFERNTQGRDLIVGDIHGCFTRLQSALNAVGFDPQAGDRLFSVGDLVDRGPESHLSLEWLDKPWFHAVQGNHEDMAIRWGKPDCRMDAVLYVRNGGGWNVGNTQQERIRFADAFQSLPLAIELETANGLVGIVHAGCPFNDWRNLRSVLVSEAISNADLRALRKAMLWDRSRIQDCLTDAITGVVAVVVGHTPIERVTSLGNHIYIDTMGWHPRGHGFTLLDGSTLRPLPVPINLVWEDAA